MQKLSKHSVYYKSHVMLMVTTKTSQINLVPVTALLKLTVLGLVRWLVHLFLHAEDSWQLWIFWFCISLPFSRKAFPESSQSLGFRPTQTLMSFNSLFYKCSHIPCFHSVWHKHRFFYDEGLRCNWRSFHILSSDRVSPLYEFATVHESWTKSKHLVTLLVKVIEFLSSRILW